jgi:hypothetical protein
VFSCFGHHQWNPHFVLARAAVVARVQVPGFAGTQSFTVPRPLMTSATSPIRSAKCACGRPGPNQPSSASSMLGERPRGPEECLRLLQKALLLVDVAERDAPLAAQRESAASRRARRQLDGFVRGQSMKPWSALRTSIVSVPARRAQSSPKRHRAPRNAPDFGAADPVLVRERVEFRPVGVDQLALAAGLDRRHGLLEKPSRSS